MGIVFFSSDLPFVVIAAGEKNLVKAKTLEGVKTLIFGHKPNNEFFRDIKKNHP